MVNLQNHSGSLSLQLSEAQTEVARLHADLQRAEAELEKERSKLHSTSVADREKVSLSFFICRVCVFGFCQFADRLLYLLITVS